LLERSGVNIAGTHAVVIGRSDIVGKPMALLLLHRNATVTVCHSRTVDLPRIASEGDILVSAIGRPGFVTPAFVKPGATVVDVGTTQVSDRSVIDRLFPVGSKRREVYDGRLARGRRRASGRGGSGRCAVTGRRCRPRLPCC
jgi:methylenetetrahydrofolate dehydrogenase (NADP+)/methenyltetrahydrofolate cyclohydrolase